MTATIFVDTNILIYAHDIEAGPRHKKALELVRGLWEKGGGVISVQVLQEFYVNITRKVPAPLPRPLARSLVETYACWPLVTPDPADLLKASEIEERYRLSFWDAMIVAAAVKARAATLWTEDLSHESLIEGIRVVNPLY
ncbi:MAG TPA: PIN domain-containing protein [Desulfobacteraceae bacterium]|nr:PIN domain-containing protein [Deltaproteobacteria bacterium]MBW2355839.1 PIN domain-containing protein [Deltaproteobacteria bacterium]RLB97459.1 MAG: PIN domain nuclease [Deltaproteobacteria bacterium]HDI60613.1 PIN domain-containing protein [Desulfobacteraceae bacterium]